MERRNSMRIELKDLVVREKNGDYLFHLKAVNLSEEGIFVRDKVVSEDHHYVSYLSFRLPNGQELSDIPAKIIRETFGSNTTGVAYHFVSMNEETRISLKKYLTNNTANIA